MISLLSHWSANLRIAYARHRAIEVMSRLTDLQLLDMGVERGAIEDYVRDGLPWQSRETFAAHPAGASLQGCG